MRGQVTASGVTLSDASPRTTSAGGSQPVNNMQPYVAVNYIIALTGVYPSRTRRLEDKEEGVYGRADHHPYNVTERQLQGGSDPFVGQITMFAGTFAPRGWALCDGALLPIASNDALFSLIGTIYGGDGTTTFGLPDLRGRVPIHYGSGPGLTPRNICATGGVETVAYSENEIPLHTHDSLDVAGLTPFDAVLSSPTSSPRPVTVSEFDPLDGIVIGSAGRNPPFDKNNMQPFQTINFAIALQGVFPSRNRMLNGEDSEGEPERPADQAHRRLFQPCLAFLSLFAFNFPPRGFAECDGQILPINQNQALFSLLGTTYGGDGRTSFGLPDLQGRTPMHAGATSNLLGQKTGVESTTLTMEKMPSHSHSFSVELVEPLIGNVTVAEDPFVDLLYQDVTFDVVPPSPPAGTSSAGGGGFDTNIQPSLGLNYIIALQGVYPSRSRRLEELHKSNHTNDEGMHSRTHRRLTGSSPFIGEIALFAGNFAPRNWAFCDGQILQISSHTALFSLLGTIYGGDGRMTFGLPDFRFTTAANRVAMHPGRGPGLTPRNLGERGGSHESVVSVGNLASHSHSIDMGTEFNLAMYE